ncbi:MAG: hypothetical protein GX268_03245 [Methanomicrobiales archaeon]|nr:hypothetical protein [Methanomicrobiales archaeon]
MDLAESILNELVTLQRKNEELLRIVSRLEHESDVIIRQFEDKILELNKDLKKALDQSVKSEKRYELLSREKEREKESFEKDKKELEEDYSGKIQDLKTTINQNTDLIREKDAQIQTLTGQVEDLKSYASLKAEEYSSEIKNLVSLHESEITKYKIKIDDLHLEYQETVSRIKEDVARKEQELRALAGDLKNRISNEKKVQEERGREKAEYDARIAEFQVLLDKTKEDYLKLQSRSNEEAQEYKEKIQDLVTELEGLEKEKSVKESELIQKLEHFEAEIRSLQERSAIDQKSIGDLTDENNNLVKLTEELHADISSKDEQMHELHETISTLKSEIKENCSRFESELTLKDDELTGKEALISELNNNLKILEEKILTDEAAHNKEVLSFTEKIEELNNQLDARKQSYSEEISRLSVRMEEVSQELEDLIHVKTEREHEFRNEITGLHEELIRRKKEWKTKLESVAQEIAEKDRHITLISGNNEALRTEMERVRTRLLMLEKTTREDKEEPVHALYRQIQNLSGKLAEKESEKAVLASRIIRLDTENTRLAQLLADSGSSPDSQKGREEVISAGVKTPSPALIRSEIFTYLANLDDPLHAMEAAASILRLGPQVTDILIPLLYEGSQNRRAWIAALLYELNDPRTTKPLSDLLETTEIGLRELIWDTRLRFREWKRAGVSSLTAQ